MLIFATSALETDCRLHCVKHTYVLLSAASKRSRRTPGGKGYGLCLSVRRAADGHARQSPLVGCPVCYIVIQYSNWNVNHTQQCRQL